MEVLLGAAGGMIIAVLMMAWLGTFARWFIVPGVDGGFVKDYGVLIKAHIDFVLMSLYCLGFYAAAKAANVEIPVLACWLIAIGGFTNPGVFVIAAFKPDFWQALWVKVYTGLSFIVTTAGFIWAASILVGRAFSAA
ncbi:hypothetical protein LG198_11255 [Methylobacillus arboreus]|uniref:hypothetical protein n=1 Tax=Methylobacillus arboreus TaxID=755170 RepID=UPI001E2BE0B1|nr:hypothetical protein [Methylobacillus arboreus]MCB5191305.1 hypothetical protein [Methylobacillus arboreus]